MKIGNVDRGKKNPESPFLVWNFLTSDEFQSEANEIMYSSLMSRSITDLIYLTLNRQIEKIYNKNNNDNIKMIIIILILKRQLIFYT